MDQRSVAVGKGRLCSGRLGQVDLLGLGMLSALHYAVDLIREHRVYEIDWHTTRKKTSVRDVVPCEPSVCSRSNLALRWQRCEPQTARSTTWSSGSDHPPGPIQGGSGIYIRRRNGQEPITYLIPAGELARQDTCVPFSGTTDEMAIVVRVHARRCGSVAPGMGSKRSGLEWRS